jgi:hypothetical protein
VRNNFLGNPLLLPDYLIANVVVDHVDLEGIDLEVVFEEPDHHNLDPTYYSHFVTLAVIVIHRLGRLQSPSQMSGEEPRRRYDLQIWIENCRWKRTATWKRTLCFVDLIAPRRLDCCGTGLHLIR